MTALHVSRPTHGSSPGVVAVAGDLDVASAAGFVEAVAAEFQASDSMVLDLAGVTFLDSTGLGALIELRNGAVGRGGRFSVRNPSSAVERVLSLVGMSDYFQADEAGAE